MHRPSLLASATASGVSHRYTIFWQCAQKRTSPRPVWIKASHCMGHRTLKRFVQLMTVAWVMASFLADTMQA